LDSLFFNITERRYRRELFSDHTRVDISNGILFIEAKEKFSLSLKNFDRMVIITCLKAGHLEMVDHLARKRYEAPGSSIFTSSRQDLTIMGEGDIFILFVADFFLKRYLSADMRNPVDFLYAATQKQNSLRLIDKKPVDALTLWLIAKITRPGTSSIICEHDVIELMIHRFALLDIIDRDLDPHAVEIARRAREHLLKNFVTPPTISQLAHLCATNENKLKKSFKEVCRTTIHSYVQRLRLEKANLLLKEEMLSIKEVAQRVGYRHSGHFSKLFFESYGVYPKDLRRR
jgi:AraC-like DNA-binding protein